MTTRRIIPPSPKDDRGAYLPPEAPVVLATPPEPHSPTPADTDLDELLGRQLLALDRVTRQLATKASAGTMTGSEITSLATCIKITLDLKIREKELLDKLTEEELERSSNGKSST